jgi:hypothetical protein
LRILKPVASVLVFGALLCAVQPATAQFGQQGSKLVGTGAVLSVGGVGQGASVALSADGNTAIVGGSGDNSDRGAAWAFTRTGGAWMQQGMKLVGSNTENFGISAALSADGNTAIVGGLAGGAWVFTRSNGVWTLQASLVGTGAVGRSDQGISVALSADGNTAIVGDSDDNSSTGAAWVFTRSGGVWAQQGEKLVGSGAVNEPDPADQGNSVALSADGNTAIIGGPGDNSGNGAVWVFTRNSSVWTQQGDKLVGYGTVGAADQGDSVGISADGNTLIIGGPGDSSSNGAVWVFTRSGGVWTQQGSKLVGAGYPGRAGQGWSVALSGDGDIAIVGGPGDNSGDGAVWVFSRGGDAWAQQGLKLVGAGAVGAAAQGASVALSADGNTAIIGGPNDGDNPQQDSWGIGAAWVFIQSDLTAAPTSGQVPLAVTFRASGLTLPMTYTINFGDGTTGALTQGNCIDMPPVGGHGGVRCFDSAPHTYSAAGSYTATLLNASDSMLGAVTITVIPVGGVKPLPVTPSPPAMTSTPTPERHSLGR